MRFKTLSQYSPPLPPTREKKNNTSGNKKKICKILVKNEIYYCNSEPQNITINNYNYRVVIYTEKKISPDAKKFYRIENEKNIVEFKSWNQLRNALIKSTCFLTFTY